MTSEPRHAAYPRDSGALGRLISLAVFLALTTGAAAIGSIATSNGQDWYDGLEKPSFNPPDWVFGPVWTTLYVFIAVAGWLVYRQHQRGRTLALAAWGLQLGLNVAWSWIFFGANEPGFALIEIAALFASILLTIALFWRLNHAAALFMVPHLVWVGFASLLNFEVWRLN